jgi:hypothetical protein
MPRTGERCVAMECERLQNRAPAAVRRAYGTTEIHAGLESTQVSHASPNGEVEEPHRGAEKVSRTLPASAPGARSHSQFKGPLHRLLEDMQSILALEVNQRRFFPFFGALKDCDFLRRLNSAIHHSANCSDHRYDTRDVANQLNPDREKGLYLGTQTKGK